MAGRIGKAFKISEKDAKGYGYVRGPKGTSSYQRNPGVTAIAAINGRGSYRSARSVMSGLSKNQRSKAAKRLTASERQAFTKRMREAKMQKNMSASQRSYHQRRKAWGRYVPPGTRIRVGSAMRKPDYGAEPQGAEKLPPGVYTTNRRKKGKNMRANVSKAQRRATAMRNLRKAWAKTGARPARGMRSNKSTTRRRTSPARRRTSSVTRRTSPARRRSTTRRTSPARRRSTAMTRNRTGMTKAKRAAAARKGWRTRRAGGATTRRRPATRRRSTAKRRMRSNRATPKQRAAARRNIKKAQAALRRRSGGSRRRMTSNRRRRSTTTRRRRASMKRRSPMRRNRPMTKARRAAAARKGWRTRRAGGMTRNRRRTSMKRRSYRSNRRRSYRSNKKTFMQKLFGRNRYRRNSPMGALSEAFQTGLLITAGFATHKVLSHVLDELVLSNFISEEVTEAAVVETENGPEVVEVPNGAQSGMEGLVPYRSLIAAGLTALVGIPLTATLVKDRETKMLVMGGMAASLLHQLLVTGLNQLGQSDVANYLSGNDRDGTAARLSAMYGMGAYGAHDIAKASIQPLYDPINGGMGEYFESGVSGLGEYFESGVSGMSGLGEYFESGVEGLGNYGNNPDILQAAAGYGGMGEYFESGVSGLGAHVDPSSDLDYELSVAEAAAGVGDVYEAAAGLGQPIYQAAAGMGQPIMQAAAGMGDINTVPTSSTWIPGSTNPQIWAGTRAIRRPQGATMMDPAGVLQTSGGDGIFG